MNSGSRLSEATRPQIRAAHPREAAWVSANAGSGKTKVLTDRVARLLLAGTLPQRILCVTFANAAAANIQNRLISRLGEWSMLPDPELGERLQELGEPAAALEPERLARTRTLFANALETPGGLKIQTLHSFASALLRQFPLEAGVSPQYVAVDERASKRLGETVLDSVALHDEPAFDSMAHYAHPNSLPVLVEEISSKRHLFGREDPESRIREMFGLAEGASIGSLASRMFTSDDVGFLADLQSVLRQGRPTDLNALARLERINASDPAERDIRILESVFLYGATAKEAFGPKIGGFPTKALRELLGGSEGQLNDYMERVAAMRDSRVSIAAAEKTAALHRFADALLASLDAQKRTAALLDFDDLILKARSLLSNPETAGWVLYRLDGGIDHILVDEAQDVSPVQWDIVSRLAEEFTAGESARGSLNRTVFAVGDEKQSIFGFQGAAPERFAEMRDHFRGKYEEAGRPFVEEELKFSFRSSEAVLNLVDSVFSDETETGFAAPTEHKAFKSDMPGRVDLWTFIEKADDGEPPEWDDASALGYADEPAHVALARSIAEQIDGLVRTRQPRPDASGGSRPISAGDFLILVQRRSELFFEIIRELKKKNLPVAGTDRLRISEELAVRDLAALLSFLAVESDDLSLAAVLKSPLFGLSEQDLYRIAASRDGKNLYRSLLEHEPSYRDAVRVLNDLRRRTDFLMPYELLERILSVHGGRSKLVARLGHEATEGINALLNQAIAYEDSEPPSLTGFLEWLAVEDMEVKRQLDEAGDEIRVMTVHGAKGLESPIVILPDTAARTPPFSNEILYGTGEFPLWKVARADEPEPVKTAREAYEEAAEMERLRLLYVALTRAESWLVICGAGRLSPDGDSWYQKVQAGLESLGAVQDAADLECRYETGDWPQSAEDIAAETPASAEIPAWAMSPVDPPEAEADPIKPSDLAGAKALPSPLGEPDEDVAKQRGSDVHHLLEHLPKHQRSGWRTAARGILGAEERELPEPEFDDVFQEAERLLSDAELQHLFSGEALAEAAVTARLDAFEGKPLLGYIDRLVVTDGGVLAVDFKTNRAVPRLPEETPDGILRQMGAYHLALEAVYPGRKVSTAILWTRTANLMPIDRGLWEDLDLAADE